jgi:hypothetical protein
MYFVNAGGFFKWKFSVQPFVIILMNRVTLISWLSHPDFHRTLADMEEMQKEAEKVFQRPLDLLTRNSIERSQNPYKRQNILDNPVVLYEKDALLPL